MNCTHIEEDVLPLQNTTHAQKRKREEVDNEREHQLHQDIHNARQEANNLNALLQEKEEDIYKLKEESTAEIKRLEKKTSDGEENIKLLQLRNKSLTKKLNDSEGTIKRLEKGIKSKGDNTAKVIQ